MYQRIRNAQDGRPRQQFTILFLIFLLLLLLYLFLTSRFKWWPYQIFYPPEAYYIQNQVIVSGPSDQLDQIIGALSPGTLQPIEERLEYDLVLGQLPCPGLPATSNVGQNFVIALFEITGGDPNVAETIQAIQEAVQDFETATGEESAVSAEPNWLSGSPWKPEGSPWKPEGSPWKPEGSPSPAETQEAAESLFMNQWGYGAIKLNRTDRVVTGNNIRIGVFDTSPFSVPDGQQVTRTVDWVTEPNVMELLVKHPVLAAIPEAEPREPEGPRDPSIDVRDHGLFVAGLIHAVAPNSDIELIRVLGTDNRGDLFTLNREIFNFMVETVETRPSGTIINMSLGIRVPPEEADFEVPAQVQSLHDLMTIARCLDIVVVAAAGNSSAELETPELAHLPADWTSVIGVAASNAGNGRACFSNRGEIAAPGGDGRSSDESPLTCRPRLADCNNQDCLFAVVSSVLKPPSETGYSYWAGSSFSAPLVSGLAALVLEMSDGTLRPADVQAIIECGATKSADRYLGEGVINVDRTLNLCFRSAGGIDIQQQE